VTTHQVEEVEHILTDVLFIEKGRIVLDAEVETLGTRYQLLQVKPEQLDAARALQPFHERSVFGRTVLFYEGRRPEELAALGEVSTPGIADLFVARMQGEQA